ncbi:transcription mediator subunit Med12 [Apiospora kogelbergensis]|uniref:Mediator of RNA polymerase II transcription subunit 12 n=1 Tax=Apiospora kogelbergensis TaxID=1337665 RepID=A0AAW0RDN5_9PEZI
MTSRPPLAVSQRQPQRSLSGPGLSQRPPHQQRTLSQQHIPPSPIRKSDGFGGDFTTADTADGSQNQARYGTTPVEGLANDGIDHAGFNESPQNLAFTPSRIMPPMNDVSDLGDLSPNPSRCPTADNDSAPLPMPPRRARFIVPVSNSRPQPATAATPAAPPKKDVRPKPFVLETPSAAPRYSNMGKQEPTGFADFYSWQGNHPEDKFNDNIIRFGYFDKAPPQIGSEYTSAKTPLYPAMKHKSGLHTLSTIFTTIMNQRRLGGQITSASTFKPPPRVTLTDTKREVWLKDLANPAISLRRLSRTIPHGIRGKVLLEQCLNKNVPTDRAVWLAKCVGANEIRAFKRKGVNGTFVMGGETKWIRDWTVFVEQFIESVVTAFGEASWKAKVTYAIRLATHLYAEFLMDRDHYLDWLVSGLESSNQARLPMWILIAQIYWNDLLRSRKNGRRLVAAILNHHEAIYRHPDRDVLLPLHTQLSSLLRSLLLANRENFIHPTTWSKHRDTILASSPADDNAYSRSYDTIEARNDRLTSTQIKSQPAVRGTVVKLLDSTLRKPFTSDLATQIWKSSDDKAGLAKIVLDWCVSLYRPGVAKIFMATAIFRSWAPFDVNITGAIIEFLATEVPRELERKHSIYHLVSELIRADQFSVPQYLQWLISRGGLSDPTEIEPDGPCLTRLLVEVPTHYLSDSMKRLRASILRRAGYSVEYEASDIESAVKCVKYSLGVPLEAGDPLLQRKPPSVKKLTKLLKLSSRALQSTVGNWIANEFVPNFAPSPQLSKAGMEMTSYKFDFVRTLLEAIGDFTMLEHTLRILVASSNAELLAACADTVNRHLPVFAGIGSAKSLFNMFLDRLKALRDEQGIGARPILASLAKLAPRIPGLADLALQLQNDLARTDRSNAVDASSPLSDNMAMQLQDDETELSESIEKLASYTSADRPTMERLFQTIINRLQNCWGKSDERQRAYCVLLTRLRVFDTPHFDTMMRGWALHIRKLTNRPPISQIFPLLVSSGCLAVPILFSTARSMMQTAQNQPGLVGFASIYTQEILQLLILEPSPNRFMTHEDCYRLCIVQEQVKYDHVKELMLLTRGALSEYSCSRHQQPPIEQPLDDEKTRAQFLELLRNLILVDSHAMSQTLALKHPDTKLTLLIDTLTTNLLIPGGGSEQQTFEQVLELANEFTLPYCQVKLSLNLAVDDASGPDGAEKLQSHLAFLSRAMDNAIEANNIMWTGILSCLNSEVTYHMKGRAETRFLDLLPSTKTMTYTDSTEHATLHMAENLLAVIESIVRGVPSPKATQLSNAMVEKLADQWEILATTSPEMAALKEEVISQWLPMVLSYVTLHATSPGSTADSSKPAQETRARACLSLVGLAQELDLAQSPTMAERAFDLALILVDSLSDEARLQCVRAVKDSASDARVRYLFSFAVNPADNLMLSHREKPSPAMSVQERRAMAMGIGMGMMPERLSPFVMRRWELLNEPTPNVGENDTSLSLHLFEARKIS